MSVEYMTVGALREILSNYQDDMPVEIDVSCEGIVCWMYDNGFYVKNGTLRLEAHG